MNPSTVKSKSNSKKAAVEAEVGDFHFIGHDSAWVKLVRITKQSHSLPPVFIFAGPEGVGKKRVALSLAALLSCENENVKRSTDPNVKPCGHCGSCRRIAQRQSESLLFISTPKPPIKVADVEPVFHFLARQIMTSARVILIDQAHDLNPQAANSLLKVFEEPPPKTLFILITNRPSLLMSTILSRSQVLRFGPLTDEHLLHVSRDFEFSSQSAQTAQASERLSLVKASMGRASQVKLMMEEAGDGSMVSDMKEFWSDFSEREKMAPEFAKIWGDRLKDKAHVLRWIDVLLLGARDFLRLSLTPVASAAVDESLVFRGYSDVLYRESQSLPKDPRTWISLMEKLGRISEDIKTQKDPLLCFEEFWFSGH